MGDLALDTHLGSRKAPSLQDHLNGSAGLEAAAGRALALRKKINDHQKASLRLYQEIRDSEEETEAKDMPVKQLLDPYMAAGYAIWLREQGPVGAGILKDAWHTDTSEADGPPLPPVTEDNQ